MDLVFEHRKELIEKMFQEKLSDIFDGIKNSKKLDAASVASMLIDRSILCELIIRVNEDRKR
jgi:hypothetical protein